MIIDEQLAQIATGRAQSFFAVDLAAHQSAINDFYAGKRVLIIGGAGTIGSACALEILKQEPAKLDIVDINENGLAALTRYIRSNALGPDTVISFNALDFVGYPMTQYIVDNGPWDSVLNFAAVKHVRSEKNVACTLHMLEVNAIKQYEFLQSLNATHDDVNYFVVSTDKAADPANLMGASKRLLEYLVFGTVAEMSGIKLSSARFANVAFSAGSLLESFRQRFEARYPLACPADTRRYFISPQEASHICLLGQVFAPTQSIVVPKMTPSEHLIQLSDVAGAFLQSVGRTPAFVPPGSPVPLLQAGEYPVLLSARDTAGEKEAEVFVGSGEWTFEVGLSTVHAIAPFVPNPVTAARCYEELKALTSGASGPVTREGIETVVRRYLENYAQIGGQNNLDDRV
jgi:NAD(P)-dependent dehydrogenase (short-subunit alcohol dehydrogenase family)